MHVAFIKKIGNNLSV